MIPPMTPSDEMDRLRALWRLKMLDTQPEERFDRITRLATEKLNMPISTISLIDKDREWYKSCQGLNVKQMPRDISFCAHTIFSRDILVVEDTLLDPRFAHNPQVIGEPKIRFYAGIPLREMKSKLVIGVFCVKDTKPRTLSKDDYHTLFDLAAQAEKELQN